jgi:oligoribonuclease
VAASALTLARPVARRSPERRRGPANLRRAFEEPHKLGRRQPHGARGRSIPPLGRQQGVERQRRKAGVIGVPRVDAHRTPSNIPRELRWPREGIALKPLPYLAGDAQSEPPQGPPAVLGERAGLGRGGAHSARTVVQPDPGGVLLPVLAAGPTGAEPLLLAVAGKLLVPGGQPAVAFAHCAPFAVARSTRPGHTPAMQPAGAPLVWLDMEMTGLDPERHTILELALIITDGQLAVIAELGPLVIHQPEEVLAAMDPWCVEHHGASGLTEASRRSRLSLAEAEARALAFLESRLRPGEAPLAGNSVHVDRAFLARHMPRLHDFFHYRNVDVSTVKELARRWYPALQPPKKAERHRALDDLRESIAELRFYRETIFREPEEIRAGAENVTKEGREAGAPPEE